MRGIDGLDAIIRQTHFLNVSKIAAVATSSLDSSFSSVSM